MKAKTERLTLIECNDAERALVIRGLRALQKSSDVSDEQAAAAMEMLAVIKASAYDE